MLGYQYVIRLKIIWNWKHLSDISSRYYYYSTIEITIVKDEKNELENWEKQ